MRSKGCIGPVPDRRRAMALPSLRFRNRKTIGIFQISYGARAIGRIGRKSRKSHKQTRNSFEAVRLCGRVCVCMLFFRSSRAAILKADTASNGYFELVFHTHRTLYNKKNYYIIIHVFVAPSKNAI